MPKVWICYDLGIDGDYEGLYYWLDKNKALECGDSMAIFSVEIPKGGDIFNVLQRKLKKAIKLRAKDRIYGIYPRGNGLYRGKFLFGTRKRAQWEGVAGMPETGEDDPE